jgi:hypothetical protein
VIQEVTAANLESVSTAPGVRRNPRPSSELEYLLEQRGCPICAFASKGERSYFAWFQIETSSTPDMRARLRGALGMCPAHARRLIDEIGESHIMTGVLREAVAGAQQAVRSEVHPAPCPACVATADMQERACNALVRDLDQNKSVRRALAEHDGLCLPHLLATTDVADPPTLVLLAERLMIGLRNTSPENPIERLAGADRDAPSRRRERGKLPPLPVSDSWADQVCLRLEHATCPVCLSTGWAERRYGEWLATRARDDDPALSTDPGELCPRHVHDIRLLDPGAAKQLIRRQQACRADELEHLLHRLAQPQRTRRSRTRRGTSELDLARARLTAARHCPACHGVQAVDRSQLELTAATLALPLVRERYERSHGMCARHVLLLADEPARSVARRYLEARLGILAWEVAETARKYAWASRHESGGPEADSWMRALVQLDGRVLEGSPAPVWRSTA